MYIHFVVSIQSKIKQEKKKKRNRKFHRNIVTLATREILFRCQLQRGEGQRKSDIGFCKYVNVNRRVNARLRRRIATPSLTRVDVFSDGLSGVCEWPRASQPSGCRRGFWVCGGSHIFPISVTHKRSAYAQVSVRQRHLERRAARCPPAESERAGTTIAGRRTIGARDVIGASRAAAGCHEI